jgi:hypothetical protein
MGVGERFCWGVSVGMGVGMRIIVGVVVGQSVMVHAEIIHFENPSYNELIQQTNNFFKLKMI